MNHQEVVMTPRLQKMFFSFAIALGAAIFLSFTYAYASSNTLTIMPVGDGLSAISGYEVSNISYTHAQDPSKISSVSFTLDAPASHVKIQLTETQTEWYQCKAGQGLAWQCDANGLPLSDATQLRVIASGN